MSHAPTSANQRRGKSGLLMRKSGRQVKHGQQKRHGRRGRR